MLTYIGIYRVSSTMGDLNGSSFPIAYSSLFRPLEASEIRSGRSSVGSIFKARGPGSIPGMATYFYLRVAPLVRKSRNLIGLVNVPLPY